MAEDEKDEGLSGDEAIIREALDMFEVCEEVWGDNQARYEEDVRFARLGDQWQGDDARARAESGRPMLTINRLPAFIRQVVNDARQNKPQIKVLPHDSGADPKTAEVINGLIRNIEATSKADLAYDTAIDCSATGGMGYFRVDLDYADDDTFDMDIRINRILNPLTVYPDPMSDGADSSDWNHCFVTSMMDEDDFEKQYPDAEKVNWEADSNEDEASWFSKDEIRIAEYWKREEVEYDIHKLNTGEVVTDEQWKEFEDTYAAMGVEIEETRKSTKKKVTQYIMTAKEILETNEWPGKYIPIVPVYGEEVYIDGQRHFFGMIHFAKDGQIMYNYWRTTTTELVAMAPKAPWIGPTGAFNTDMQNWQVANTENLPFLEYDGDIPPQRQPFAGPPAGALQEALNAADDIKAVLGMHDASMGAQSNEISGIAIGKRVREGDTSNFHFVDNMSRAIRHAGVIIIDLIPKVYSTPRVVRILGQDEQPQNVAINQPIENPDQMLEGHFDDQDEAIANIYDLSVGKYDVTVKAGPSYTTQREEARDSMIALLQAFPQASAVVGDLVVEAMDWPNADAFAKRLKATLPPGVIDEEQDPQAAAMAAQMQEMDAVIQQLMAGKEEAQAKIAVDRDKLQIDAENAKTNRIKAETDMRKLEADIAVKDRQFDLEAAKAMKDTPLDDTPRLLKEMELNHDQAKSEMSNELERRKLELEEAKVRLEEARFELEKYRAEVEACAAMTSPGPMVDVEMDVEPKEEAKPVQVFNVQSGSKKIKIERDANNNITGATVDEGDDDGL